MSGVSLFHRIMPPRSPRAGSAPLDEALRRAVRRAAARLQHIASLASLAASGPEPRQGADYILDASDVLRELRAALKRT